jgi:3-isopropylmalate/(R)-2-methylmalate dehydratase small subunit
MAGFTAHQGRIAVYNEDQVDTDRIIPARFLSRVSRSGYGELLFSDVRGEGFILDQPESQGADVLVVGLNFGCGSSREHAVWALQQAGFKAVISRAEPDAPGFSDIFRNNSGNCGLLLIELPPGPHAALVAAGTGSEVSIDLPAQTVSFGGETHSFEISAGVKDQLIKGLDLVGTTLEYSGAIKEFESGWSSFAPDSETLTPAGTSKD